MTRTTRIRLLTRNGFLLEDGPCVLVPPHKVVPISAWFVGDAILVDENDDEYWPYSLTHVKTGQRTIAKRSPG